MADDKAQKIIVIVGPTASGKSSLAIKIAKKLSARGGPASGRNGAEIISADSRQVYRRLDIGTGKVPRDGNPKLKILNSKRIRQAHRPEQVEGQAQNSKSKTQNKEYYSSGVQHHLIDVASPKRQFTADDFKKLGEKATKEILAKNKIPIVVGGTGFYIDVLLGRMSVAEVPPNKKLRARFDKLAVEHLFKMLKKLDPRRAKTVESKNKRRLIRALEIVFTTGQPVSKPDHESGIMNYDTLWIGLKPKNLEKRIKQRLDKRLQSGMIREVENLHEQGISWKRLDEFGLEYRWISRYLKDHRPSTVDYRHFVKSKFYEILLRNIIKYSKRQMTWFKRNPEIRWINPPPGGQKEAERLVSQFLNFSIS